ncbi:UNVERIFIED_CONTAM: Iridoid oxidase [Sesamum latifolium]|uniref:Iridoid oxidase n=1 Tax=Sesamum latifolium TaxID=2727402 RepID=A0AAW2UWX6_9LAMI
MSLCDPKFNDCFPPDSLTALDYHQCSVAIGAYHEYWRRLHRICVTEFLVHKRVDASFPIRRNCLEKKMKWIKEDVEECKKNGRFVEIQHDRFLFNNSFNIIGNLILSREVMESKRDKVGEFFNAFVMFSL